MTDWPTKQTPRWMLAGSVTGIVLDVFLRTRQTRQVTEWASDLGGMVGTRWKDSDAREAAMLEHTLVLQRLTIVVAICAVISMFAVIASAVLVAIG
jgi:hypothetical protein